MSERPANDRSASNSVSASTHPCRLRLFAPTIAPAETAPPKLWLAILTYNALAYTKRCLLSLDRFTSQPWHAVILDNGSVDGTREWLAAIDDPRISIELGTSNRGVAGGRNRLVELIRDRVPDDGWIVFVDNDLEFFPNWLAPFFDVFARDPQVGMASCSGFEMVVHESHRELLSYPGLIPMPVEVASGGYACFVRPAVFRTIGEYDEQLNPFWHEDDDITVRTRVAGWQTYAVPNASVVHHGHKSGTANPSIAHLGSRAKQAYLVGKWRNAGLVMPDGRLRVGQPFDHDTLGDALAPRLHRAGAIRRSEYERARLDVAQLADVWTTKGALTERVRYASAPALALLDELVAHDESRADRVALRDAVLALREQRRRLTRLPNRTATSERAVSTFADVSDWDNDAWYQRALKYAGDGRGRMQWYDRTAAVWEATQAAFALEQHGALTNDARALIVGDLRRHVVWSIAERAGAVIVADLLEKYGAAPNTDWLDNPHRFALREVPANRVSAVSLQALTRSRVPAVQASAAVIFGWSGLPILMEQLALLNTVIPHLRPHALIVTSVLVRLSGPPDARALDSEARLAPWLNTLGLDLVDAPQAALSDDTLLAAIELDSPDPRTPDLLIVDGPRLFGRLLITCRVRQSS